MKKDDFGDMFADKTTALISKKDTGSTNGNSAHNDEILRWSEENEIPTHTSIMQRKNSIVLGLNMDDSERKEINSRGT